MSTEPSTLRAYVLARMEELGLSQTDLAERSGLSMSDINGIVKGRIKLPGADKRRNLAKALKVTHLDIFVAAGELTEEEARELGGGLTERDPDPRKERLITLVRTAAIPGPYYVGLFPMLEALQPGAQPTLESVERSGASDQ